MKKTRSRPVRRRGISRIDQPSTRTYGWFVRAAFYKRPDGSYAPRHRKFFGDASYGGQRRALRGAREDLGPVGGGRGEGRARGPWREGGVGPAASSPDRGLSAGARLP